MANLRDFSKIVKKKKINAQDTIISLFFIYRTKFINLPDIEVIRIKDSNARNCKDKGQRIFTLHQGG